MKMFGLCLSLLATASAASLLAAPSPLSLLVGAQRYSEPVYARKPEPPNFLYFTGETIRLRLDLSNLSDAADVLRCDTAMPQDIVSMKTTLDGAPVAAAVTVDQTSTIQSAGLGPRLTSLDEPLALPARAYVRFVMSIATDGWSPGEYVLDFDARCRDQQGDPLRARASRFFFELREPRADAQVELLRREAMQFYFQQRYNDAEATLTRLERMHPNSYEVHALRGHIAAALRDSSRAETEFEAAAALIERDADTLFTRFAAPRERDAKAKGLRSNSPRP